MLRYLFHLYRRNEWNLQVQYMEGTTDDHHLLQKVMRTRIYIIIDHKANIKCKSAPSVPNQYRKLSVSMHQPHFIFAVESDVYAHSLAKIKDRIFGASVQQFCNRFKFPNERQIFL